MRPSFKDGGVYVCPGMPPVRDPKVTVRSLLDGLGADAVVRRFTRVKVGEE